MRTRSKLHGAPDVIQADFFRKVSNDCPWVDLFDEIPGIYFFAKDRDGKCMRVSRNTAARHGLSPTELIGTTDFDLSPAFLANEYKRHDQKVFETGIPVRGIIELWPTQLGHLDWYSTSKFPLHDDTGVIIGLMGLIQRHSGNHASSTRLREIDPALRALAKPDGFSLSVSELATLCGMSRRQLERKFKQLLETSPGKFIIKTRIHAACRALEMSDGAIGEIALDCGFCDNSSFTAQFRKTVGLSPFQYRQTSKSRR